MKKVKILQYNLLLLVSILGILSCDSGSVTDNEVQFPESDISFFTDVEPFIERKCDCHYIDGEALSVLNLSSASAVEQIKFTLLLIPNDPDNSKLYNVLLRPAVVVSPMPPEPRLPATENQRNGIYTWIMEGATTVR
jgi:hypothetical protein